MLDCTNRAFCSMHIFLHSLLKVASILERRLKTRGVNKGATRLLENTEELHEKIVTLKRMGMKIAKFCHVEVLLQM